MMIDELPVPTDSMGRTDKAYYKSLCMHGSIYIIFIIYNYIYIYIYTQTYIYAYICIYIYICVYIYITHTSFSNIHSHTC